MRLLSIDGSSTSTGLAFFESADRHAWTHRLQPAAAWPWRRRMRWITQTLREVLATNGILEEPPDVVAIEDAVVGKYASTAIAVAECRGWLLAHVDSLWPEVRTMTITPGAARKAVGLSSFARRAHSKARYRLVAEYLGLPATASEDEADAVCIGLAAIAQLRVEGWERQAAVSS